MTAREEWYLRPLKPAARQNRYAAFDIETPGGDAPDGWTRFVVGAMYDGGKVHYATTADDLLSLCCTENRAGTIYYAHNGGRFDFKFLIEASRRLGWECEVASNGGTILFFTVRRPMIHRGKVVMVKDKDGAERPKMLVWKFYDFMQVMLGSLAQLCDVFQVEHPKEAFDHSTVHEDSPELRQYLGLDVISLFEVVGAFYAQPMLAGVSHRPTTAGVSMAVFRTRYLDDDIPVLRHVCAQYEPPCRACGASSWTIDREWEWATLRCHACGATYWRKRDKEAYVRLGYYGGRTEPFILKGRNVTEHDLNSAYVWAMTQPMPYGAGSWVREWRGPEVPAFYHAIVTVPESTHIPALPWRHAGKLFFPTGPLEGVWYMAELQAAMDLGATVRVVDGLMFAASTFLKSYAEASFEYRHLGPKGSLYDILGKLFGNGLYGRFGMDRDRQMTKSMTPEEAYEKGAIVVSPELGFFDVAQHSHASTILPHIAAAVTSLVRVRLLEGLLKGGEASAYCDTDSVQTVDGVTFPTSSALGDFKLEAKFDGGIWILPKFYSLEAAPGEKSKRRAKGFPHRIQSKFTHADYERFATGAATASGQWENMGGFRLLMRMPMDSPRRVGFGTRLVARVRYERTVKQLFDKRCVLPDGIHTRAWSTEEILRREREGQQYLLEEAAESYAHRFARAEVRRIRREILAEGGINDPQYETIPSWARRRNGRRLDDIAMSLHMTENDLLQFLVTARLVA